MVTVQLLNQLKDIVINVSKRKYKNTVVQFLNQLEDIVINVSKRKCKNTVAEMFCIERAFAKKTLLAWFNEKIKSQHLEIDAFMKIQYERKNLIS